MLKKLGRSLDNLLLKKKTTSSHRRHAYEQGGERIRKRRIPSKRASTSKRNEKEKIETLHLNREGPVNQKSTSVRLAATNFFIQQRVVVTDKGRPVMLTGQIKGEVMLTGVKATSWELRKLRAINRSDRRRTNQPRVSCSMDDRQYFGFLAFCFCCLFA